MVPLTTGPPVSMAGVTSEIEMYHWFVPGRLNTKKVST
jgi:hypothetical protein